MRKLIALLALLTLMVLAPSVSSEEPAHHHHRILVREAGPGVAQTQYYVATCSRNDLYLRFTNLADARKAADDHARATGHTTGVIKE